jgi:CheY-like chemotaxis protein
MLEVSISKKAVLQFNPHRHLPAIEADATQIRQVIMNLVINASEAIGENNGTITITTGYLDCDQSYLRSSLMQDAQKEGLYVYFEVLDTGCGMDNETLAKIFDPFFTTKFTGRGLGMAAVLGIVRGHKGVIKVSSEVGKGTSFKVLLPASSRKVDSLNIRTQDDNWKGEGKVLLVDDEETVRGIGAEMLEKLGFTVLTAEDGRDALEKFKTSENIAFVILDLTMPRMDGEQCLRELRKLKPNVKIIVSSGFSDYEIAQKFAGERLAGFIQKPYNLSTLRAVVQNI